MAVFTEVPADAARNLLGELQLGDLRDLRGIQGGIENTNYFVDSEQDGQVRHWVLTLFERLTAQQLPFYLYLMKHLAGRGIPVPDPQGNASGDILLEVCGKPAAVVNRLEDLPHDPHLQSVDFWTVAEHPTEGLLRFPGAPVDLAATPMRMTRMQPRLGEHSAEILRELGFDDASIAAFTGPQGCCKGNDA